MVFVLYTYTTLGVTLILYSLIGWVFSVWVHAWKPEASSLERKVSYAVLFVIGLCFVAITAVSSVFILLHR